MVNWTSQIPQNSVEIGNTVQEGVRESWKVVQSRGKSLKMLENQGKFTVERGPRRKGVLRDLLTGPGQFLHPQESPNVRQLPS